MAKKTSKSLSAEQVAQKAKPYWKVVPVAPAADSATSAPIAEATTPEIGQLYRKYFGSDFGSDKAAAPRNKKVARRKESKMILMEPKNAADARPGRKVVVVEDGRVVGEQG